jgi:hypothetical protein
MLIGGRKFVQKKRELHLHLNQQYDAFRPVQRDAMPAFAWEPGRSVRGAVVCASRLASSERGMSCAHCDEWGDGVELSCSKGSMPRCFCQVVSFCFPTTKQQQTHYFFCSVAFMILTSTEALGCK